MKKQTGEKNQRDHATSADHTIFYGVPDHMGFFCPATCTSRIWREKKCVKIPKYSPLILP